MAVRRRAYPRRWFLALPAFPVHAAAALAAGGFLLVAVFQIALALGVPWGRGAWGGVHGDVPVRRLEWLMTRHERLVDCVGIGSGARRGEAGSETPGGAIRGFP
jgi:hypothetical protein